MSSRLIAIIWVLSLVSDFLFLCEISMIRYLEDVANMNLGQQFPVVPSLLRGISPVIPDDLGYFWICKSWMFSYYRGLIMLAVQYESCEEALVSRMLRN